MISVVVVDLGGVACRFEPDRRLEALSAATGLAPKGIARAIWGSGLDERMEVGALSPDEAYQAVLAALDNRLDLNTLRAAWSAAFVPDRVVCRLISRLHTDRVLFTNNGPIVTDCLAHELQVVSRLFSRTICSWELSARKPDPLAFTRMAEELDRLPGRIVFVDDTKANCLAADSVGMKAIHFVGEPSLAGQLDRIGLFDL